MNSSISSMPSMQSIYLAYILRALIELGPGPTAQKNKILRKEFPLDYLESCERENPYISR